MPIAVGVLVGVVSRVLIAVGVLAKPTARGYSYDQRLKWQMIVHKSTSTGRLVYTNVEHKHKRKYPSVGFRGHEK